LYSYVQIFKYPKITTVLEFFEMQVVEMLFRVSTCKVNQVSSKSSPMDEYLKLFCVIKFFSRSISSNPKNKIKMIGFYATYYISFLGNCAGSWITKKTFYTQSLMTA